MLKIARKTFQYEDNDLASMEGESYNAFQTVLQNVLKLNLDKKRGRRDEAKQMLKLAQRFAWHELPEEDANEFLASVQKMVATDYGGWRQYVLEML